MATRRKCVCCGKEYDQCPNCAKANQPGWMVTFCTIECKELFNIVSAYNVKRVGKAAVQKFVADHGITNTSRYADVIRKVLEETREEQQKVIPVQKDSRSKVRSKKRNQR